MKLSLKYIFAKKGSGWDSRNYYTLTKNIINRQGQLQDNLPLISGIGIISKLAKSILVILC